MGIEAVRVDVGDSGNGVSVLVGTAKVEVSIVVAVAVGTGVAIPQAVKWIVIVKIKSKLDNQCDVFIAHPKSN